MVSTLGLKMTFTSLSCNICWPYYSTYVTSRSWSNLMKVIPETRRGHLIWYIRFYYYNWVDTSAGGLIVSDGIIHPVISAPALAWFIRYIYYWKLQFQNNVLLLPFWLNNQKSNISRRTQSVVDNLHMMCLFTFHCAS